MSEFDLSGALRRIRREADLSQRQLARACGVAVAVISHAEAGRRGLTVSLLNRAAALAGLRLSLVSADGREVSGMADDAVRDMGGRRFPAHLDTRYTDEGWWHDDHHWTRPRAWYSFDLDRDRRDGRRQSLGTPDDHQLPQPGDSPWDRAEARHDEAERHRRDQRERRFLAGELRDVGPDLVCSCPPECAELDVGERPVHTDGCPCLCDID